MLDAVKRNIERNKEIARNNAQLQLLAVVSGNDHHQEFWQRRFQTNKATIFGETSDVPICSIVEATPKGNFLGTLNAWHEVRRSPQRSGALDERRPMLFSMLFGQGTRLSPFTQTLGNCKPGFPTTYRSAADLYLSIGELSVVYSNALVDHLARGGFKGVLVKWGDETIIPSAAWRDSPGQYADVDAVRFVWGTQPTEDLAREKEWILFDPGSGLMRLQLSRQPLPQLLAEAASRGGSDEGRLAVNLGSLAISYPFLETALEIFQDDLADTARAADWDPHAWAALVCRGEDDWRQELRREEQSATRPLTELVGRYPDFFAKVSAVRGRLEARLGRPLRIKVLDYGEPLWTDLGQHLALRRNLGLLCEPSPQGDLTRSLFGVPLERDDRGNTIVDSSLPPEARIANSIVIGSTIRDPASQLEGGLLLGGTFGRVSMPQGGAALFSDVDELAFGGPHAVCFRSKAARLRLGEAARHTTLAYPGGRSQLFAHESITSFKGDEFDKPVLRNTISFREAASLVKDLSPDQVERLWHDIPKEDVVVLE